MTGSKHRRGLTAERAQSEALPRAQRRGSILVEFALVAIAFYLLLAGTIEIGRMITTSQIVQNAARTAARELALMPLPATITFDTALQCDEVQARIFDRWKLCVRLNQSTSEFTDTWPIVNRMLLPLMVVGEVDGEKYLHFPGAIVRPFNAPEGLLTVMVPQVRSRGASGVETIVWVPVLEEVRSDNPDPNFSPFSANSLGNERGLVALRINCPYQATTMTAYQSQDIGSESPQNVPIEANDSAVQQDNSPGGILLGGATIGAYSGQYGLGKFYALKKEVRPFRRLVSAQAIFRREVFASGPCPTTPP